MKHTPFIYFLLLLTFGLIQCPLSGQQAFPEELKNREPQSLEEVKLLERQVQSVIEKVSPATVSINGEGSGVVINEEGIILTVAHVNRRVGRRVQITFADGSNAWGETLGNNFNLDAGLIKITSDGEFPFVEMAESSDHEPGEWCMAVGFPVSFDKGLQPAARLGRILSCESGKLVSDCVIMGGDSGGPLFDLDGNVIGINSRVNGSLNSNIHVPVSIFKRDWDKMMDGKDIRNYQRGNRRDPNRGYLGIRGPTDASPAKIETVIDGSAAAEAGLQVEDIITEIDGKAIESFADIGKALSGKKVGDTISISVERGEEVLNYKIKLGRQ